MSVLKNFADKTKLLIFFEKAAVQWFVLFGIFFATVAVLFVMNDNFSSDAILYSSITRVKQKEPSAGVVKVILDFGNGRKRAFEGAVSRPLTAADALRGAREAGGFSLKINLSGEIAEIDRIKVADSKRWYWYLDGARQERPILDTLVKGGDTILFRYE